ncbi:MAG: hypothetical protein A2583_10470 [Bdellovibrionales bacterium RIFOXYD1_FULL_53_11]|nr:MAG: hypothetical protein A2583_10470 [Bdellovibrionales bacterium RIFOXYD1_FULL_53_11]
MRRFYCNYSVVKTGQPVKNTLMNKTTKVFLIAAPCALAAAAVFSCGKSDGTAPPIGPIKYSAAVNSGDLADWTIDGNNFTVAWTVMDASGNETKKLNLNGTCGEPDPVFSFRLCKVAGTSDNATISIGAEFQVFEVPGVFVVAHPKNEEARSSRGTDEFHIGYIGGECGTMASGMYAMIRAIPKGVKQNDMFGLMDFHVESNQNSYHGELGIYRDGTGSFRSMLSVWDAVSLPLTTNPSCSGGVYKVTDNGTTIRMITTKSGTYIADMGRGQPQTIMFKTEKTGTIDDISNRTFYGIMFDGSSCTGPAGSCTKVFRMEAGAKDDRGRVQINLFKTADGLTLTSPFKFMSTSNVAIGGERFTGTSPCTAGHATYDAASLGKIASDYPDATTYPGLVYSDEVTAGQETPTILFVQKNGDNVLLMGIITSVNASWTCQNQGNANSVAQKGNFIAFSTEKK